MLLKTIDVRDIASRIVALNLAVGEFKRNREMGIGRVGGGGAKRGRVFEYHCVKTVKKTYITFYLKTMFEVSMLRSLPLQLPHFSSVKTSSPRHVSWALKSAWSAPYSRTSSVKVMALSKSWYRLYPVMLGLTAIALNIRELPTGGSCLKSPKKTV